MSDSSSPRPERTLGGDDAARRLHRLEAEAIHIFREAVAQCARPVMLYSIGKDSAVLLHLAMKAFAPARLPFPLLHIDTGWKFAAMIEHRDKTAAAHKLDLIVHTNPEGLAQGVSPPTHGSQTHTRIMKTEALKQALDEHRFDAAFGGARRDEEKSRSKERVFSMRAPGHRWDPKSQRPEMWGIYNARLGPGQSVRVFPLSNWTERDVWLYIAQEGIDVVPLYFASELPVLERDGQLIVRDDDRLPLLPGETPQAMTVRFRSLGCYPLTSAVRSDARDVSAVLQELETGRSSERGGRLIDKDHVAAMERNKTEGYF